eukprot:1694287-Alexandrium_andersonii.AAC.2
MTWHVAASVPYWFRGVGADVMLNHRRAAVFERSTATTEALACSRASAAETLAQLGRGSAESGESEGASGATAKQRQQEGKKAYVGGAW